MTKLEKMTNKRSVLVAGFINLIFPGLGFLYIGKPAHAIGLPVILFLLMILLPWITTVIGIPGFLAVVAVYGILLLGSTIWVCKTAYNQSDIPLKRYQKWYVYLSYIAVFVIATYSIQTIRSNLWGYELYRMPSGSMMPTLLIGDFIIVDTSYYKSSVPHRGDVIVFNFPKHPETLLIKRVVGLPGDKIGYFKKRLYINDTLVKTTDLGKYSGIGKGSFMTGAKLYKEDLKGISYDILITENPNPPEGSIAVPDDQYFVIGDNRDNSNDSRYQGFVPKGNIIGKVMNIWMNWDIEVGIDASRIGKSVE